MIVGSNILAGASGQAGYFLQRSVRLRRSVSAYFNRTPASATNRKTWTWSGWVKRGTLDSSALAAYPLFAVNTGTSDSTWFEIRFLSDLIYVGGYSTNWRATTQVFRDPSAWYHIVLAVDTTQATANDRLKLYVNGLQVTAFNITNNPAQNADLGINQATPTYIGQSQSQYFDGYLTEINFIDGQALTPASFGEYNTITGVWQPKKYGGAYGTNGFYLNFNDNSAATAAAIGKDSSGNGNNWTPNNISVTAGVTYDSMTDVPTLTSPTTSNFSVLNPISVQGVNAGIANGNLSVTLGTAANRGATGTIFVPSGKWYFEMIGIGSAAIDQIGVISDVGSFTGGSVSQGVLYWGNGNKTVDGTSSSYGASYTTNDIIGVALDNNSGSITFYKNNISQGAIALTIRNYAAAICTASGVSAGPFNINFGQRPFSYTPPTGFVALNTYNLPDSTISNGANQMAATIYTGTGVAQNINNTVNGISFQPDLVWVKARSFGYSHRLANSITGATNYLDTAQTAAQFTDAGNSVSSFNSNGFGVGTYVSANNNTTTYVGWQWKASNATAVTNTSGSITSSVSANTTAGFSIVTYTGTGANATVGHGLGIAPKMIIVKDRSGAGQNWGVYHSSLGNTGGLALNLTNSLITASGWWNNTSPTSSVFSLGGSTGSDWFTTNKSGDTYVAYCFSEIAGYSKIGSYIGNGNADGVFVYTGFRPRWILAKSSTTAATNWFVVDTTRSPTNVTDKWLLPNGANAEQGQIVFDILSNGFKLRNSAAEFNTNASTYIYIAFAENPFKNSLAR